MKFIKFPTIEAWEGRYNTHTSHEILLSRIIGIQSCYISDLVHMGNENCTKILLDSGQEFIVEMPIDAVRSAIENAV